MPSTLTLAVVSDIHGNLPARDAVLGDLARPDVDLDLVVISGIACQARCGRGKPRTG